MTEHPNAVLVRRGYAAFSSGDFDTLREIITPDANHRVPGRNPISGDHKGIDSILALYADLFTRSGGTIKVELEDVLVNDDNQAVAIHTSTAEREGRTIRQREALLFTIHDGHVVEIVDFFGDIEEQDRFWS